jgi:formate C-acetyltransferase
MREREIDMTITDNARDGIRDDAEGAAAWRTFTPGPWQDAIDLRDFIQRNYEPYAGVSASMS